MTAGLQHLAWDSNWLGLPVARFVAPEVGAAAALATAVAQCQAGGVRLLYLVLDSADVPAAEAARRAGAWLADVKLTYEMPLSAAESAAVSFSPGVQVASVGHVSPALVTLALQSGEYSRFRRDALIDPQAFEELYTSWLRRSLREGTVWAATAGAEMVGLLAFAADESHASIELLAVGPAAQRRGIGQGLVQRARHEAQRLGSAALHVVTQGANVPACNFYERCGFRLARTEHWYHLWF